VVTTIFWPGEEEEVERVVADASAHIEEEHLVHGAQLAQQEVLVLERDVGGAEHGAGAREEGQVGHARGREQLAEVGGLAVEQALHARARARDAEEEVLVGGAEIEIGEHDALAELGAGNGQVAGHQALSHAALAASDADDVA
jgi:hypothetical protein